MQEDQKPEFVFYLFLIISQIRERGNREFFRLISYLLDIRHRRSKRCRLGIVHRWTSTLETEHAKENGGTHEQKTLSTPAAAGTQAGRLPLPHNPAPEETSQRPDTPGVCNCEDGNCLALDDGDTCACPQMISFSVCCKWFRWAVLPLDRTLEAEIYRDRDLKRCAECGGVFVPKSNRGKYCPDCAARVHRRQKTESERKRRSAVDS